MIDGLEIVMIAAVAENGVIGAGPDLPWRLPTDMKRFKAMTLGKPVIMGRRTFDTLGKPLPGRDTIVVSRSAGPLGPGVILAPSLAGALDAARECAAARGVREIVIAGGGELYREALPLADRLEITRVHAAPPGDVTFPEIDPDEWTVVASEEGAQTMRDSAPFTYLTYCRRRERARVGDTSLPRHHVC